MNYQGTYIGVDLQLHAAAPDQGEALLTVELQRMALPVAMLDHAEADWCLAYVPPVVFLAGQVFNVTRNYQLPSYPGWTAPQVPWWVFFPVTPPVAVQRLAHCSFRHWVEGDRALEILFDAFCRFDGQLKETLKYPRHKCAGI